MAVEDGRRQWGTARNCEGRLGLVGGGGGLQGTAQVMSRDVKRIRLEVYDINLASTGGPSTRTIVPYSPSGPHLPGRSPSLHSEKDRLEV